MIQCATLIMTQSVLMEIRQLLTTRKTLKTWLTNQILY